MEGCSDIATSGSIAKEGVIIDEQHFFMVTLLPLVHKTSTQTRDDNKKEREVMDAIWKKRSMC